METMYILSGGCMYRGVGVIVPAQFRKSVSHFERFVHGNHQNWRRY